MDYICKRILLILSFVSLATIGSDGMECKKWPPADHSPNAIIKIAKRAVYFPLMKKITLSPSQYAEKLPADERIWSHNVCSTLESSGPVGKMKLEVTVSYNDSKSYSGTLESKKNQLPVGDVSKVSMHAELTMVLTDKKTWFLAYSCLFGREPYWFVMSSQKKLEPNIETKILDHVEKVLGFSREVEPTDSTNLKPYQAKLHDCNEKAKNDSPVPDAAGTSVLGGIA